MRPLDIKPCGSRLLQPLREIGLPEKTQCWDMEDIQAALREAYVLGIPVEKLYGTGSDEASVNGRIIKPQPSPRRLKSA